MELGLGVKRDVQENDTRSFTEKWSVFPLSFSPVNNLSKYPNLVGVLLIINDLHYFCFV